MTAAQTGRGAGAVTVVPSGPLHGALRAPASKSLTNRVLLVAALADGTSRLTGPLVSDDSAAMLTAIRALGATVQVDGDLVTITGTGGHVAAPDEPVDCRLSGTTMRFGLAVGALAVGAVTLTGAPPLLRRPIGPLCDALEVLGARVTHQDGFPPATVGGGLRGGAVEVDVSGSSQYASAILLAAPYAAADVTVLPAGEAADAYIEMTADLMRRWGARVDAAGQRRWLASAGGHYRARDEEVEYDASAAAHLYGLASATGGTVTVTNAAAGTLQPDARITQVLVGMGATVEVVDASVTVTGPEQLSPVAVDLSAMPDQVTTIAVLAALAEGTSQITGVGVTRGHETDRLAALATELRKAGAQVEEEADGLRISGPATRAGATLQTYDDHRLAMAFAALGARVGATIEDPGCVAKTYPGFWDAAAALGLAATFD